MAKGSAARFAKGMSVHSTNSTAQQGRVPIARGSGRGKAGGLPGYIKTGQDASSGGLANPRQARGRSNAGPHREGPIPSRAGESRKNWESSDSVRGSSDKSYRATSTHAPGSIRRLGEPKAPASRSRSEGEGRSLGEAGRKNAVSGSPNRFPAGGIGQGKSGGHASIRGGQGSAKASGQGAAARGGFTMAGQKGKSFAVERGGGRGTMESLRGRAKMGSGKGTMY